MGEKNNDLTVIIAQVLNEMKSDMGDNVGACHREHLRCIGQESSPFSD